ncbi:MAG: hypothetical protein F6J86_20105 [Symploca sp. SIO1B1]|nr:hypothetical protein [Symploca sp. SIO1B1]
MASIDPLPPAQATNNIDEHFCIADLPILPEKRCEESLSESDYHLTPTTYHLTPNT